MKAELRPLLSLAIQSFLTNQHPTTIDLQSKDRDFAKVAGILARWNGFELSKTNLEPSILRLPLGQGLVAEQAVFAPENYTIWTRKTKKNERKVHPPFTSEDASWYKALEDRINDNLDRWEENALQRRQQRLNSVKEWAKRVFDEIQAPVSQAFGFVTARLGPIMDQIQAVVQSNLKIAQPSVHNRPESPIESMPVPEEWKRNVQGQDFSPDDNFPTVQTCRNTDNKPEDLIIVPKGGDSLILLEQVQPSHRLLALPVVTVDNKSRPPYRLRLARGGLVITVSIIALGALPPTYRSLRFILEYPKTAEVVMITLVASVAYNLWSWRYNARTRQRELIAAAIQSRLIARDEAAVSFLAKGAVEALTEVLMESYVSMLLSSKKEKKVTDMDPFIVEMGESVGLFCRPEHHPSDHGEEENSLVTAKCSTSEKIVAENWEKAQKALVHALATHK